jgi:hypothetical protein
MSKQVVMAMGDRSSFAACPAVRTKKIVEVVVVAYIFLSL